MVAKNIPEILTKATGGSTGEPLHFAYTRDSYEWRMAVAFSMVFPLGFFLGMPFPLGILLIERMPSGAGAWAWAMNGLFTVVGGLLSVILSMHIGFQRSLLVALGFYGLAVGAFYAVKRASIQHVDGARQPDAEVELRQTT